MNKRKWFIPVLAIVLVLIASLVVVAVIQYKKICREMDPIAGAIRSPSQYAATLAAYKTSGMVNHFPATIPSSAVKVHFATHPGALQGGTYVQLRMQLPRKEIQAILTTARATAWHVDGRCDDAVPNLHLPTTLPTGSTNFSTADDPSQPFFPDSYTFYEFPPVTKTDIEQCYGIAISGATNEVVYFAESIH